MEKISFYSVIIGLSFLSLTSCKNNISQKTIKLKTNALKTNKASFQESQPMAMSIEGMICSVGCAALIEKNLNKTNGIKEAKVDFETKKATLIFNPKVITPNEVAQIVLNTGEAYSVKDFELLD
tara:strand:- start:1252 stop:1623 length:372 start_codon:yes stop_codon:yes gene_type:complete